MNFLQKYLFPLWGELLIVLLFLFVSNNFLGDRRDLIQADGRGYYEYLPATFIYRDLQLGYLDTLKSEFYDNEFMSNDFYPRLENGKRFDKYFVGTAVLQLPFFLAGHAWAIGSQHAADGFSSPYQYSIYIAALCYTFFGLIFLRLLLATYNVNRFWILIAQLGVIFCSSAMNYIHWDAAYSHIYSFFLVSGFLFFVRKFLLTGNGRPLFWCIIILGFIFLVRPVNVIIILFIPLLAENTKQILDSLKTLKTINLSTTIFAIIIAAIVCQIQCLVWYFQTGNWIYYSYGKETFNWFDPMFIDFLFSYRKGFFLWAPWFFVLLTTAMGFHFLRGKWFRLSAFVFPFLMLIYVLSSWWSWTYGGSIGSRPMIDFYPVLIAFAAPMLAVGSGFAKWIVLIVSPVFAYIAITQVYQYQKYILLFDGMEKESYWRVFLKRQPMYEFYLWRHEVKLGTQVSETDWKGFHNIQADRWFVSDTLVISHPPAAQADVGQVVMISDHKNGSESMEIRILDMDDSLLFNHYSNMLHVTDEARGKRNVDYRFEIGRKLPQKFKAVFVMNTKEVPVTIDSMKIRFFTH